MFAKRLLQIVAVFSLAAFFAANASAGIYRLIDCNFGQNGPFRVNDSGQVCNGGQIWRNGTVSSISSVQGESTWNYSPVFGLNKWGQVGGFIWKGTTASSVVADTSGILVDLFTTAPIPNNFALGINDAQKVVGTIMNSSRNQSDYAYIYDGSLIHQYANNTGLPYFTGMDINNNTNSLFVACNSSYTGRSYLTFGYNGLDASAKQIIAPSGWNFVYGMALNNNNSAAGFAFNSVTHHAFRWDYSGGTGTYNNMHPASIWSAAHGSTNVYPDYSDACDINDDNVMVGGCSGTGFAEPTVWFGSSASFVCDNLESMNGFSALNSASGVNLNGDITGAGTKNGIQRAYLAMLLYRIPTQIICNSGSGTLIYGDRNKVRNSGDGNQLVINSFCPGLSLNAASAELVFSGLQASSVNNFDFTLTASTNPAETVTVAIYNNNTGVYDTKAVQLNGTVFNIPAGDKSKYIAPNGDIRWKVSAVDGLRAFTMSIDQAQVWVH